MDDKNLCCPHVWPLCGSCDCEKNYLHKTGVCQGQVTTMIFDLPLCPEAFSLGQVTTIIFLPYVLKHKYGQIFAAVIIIKYWKLHLPLRFLTLSTCVHRRTDRTDDSGLPRLPKFFQSFPIFSSTETAKKIQTARNSKFEKVARTFITPDSYLRLSLEF